jgi:rhodanese-related sulfurtransferase
MMTRKWRVVIAILCGVCTVSAVALSNEQGAVYGVCKVEPIAIYSTKPKLLTKRNRHLYLAVADAFKKYQQGQLVIVDVRRSDAFSHYRIPGSINLPLHQVRHKAFLKAKQLLLVNDGKSYRQLESVAQALENSGFNKVSLLDGGLPAWEDFSHLIDGKAGAVASLKFISVKEFLSESNHGPWLVVNLGKPGSFSEPVNGEIVDLAPNPSMANVLNLKVGTMLSQLPRVLFVSDDKQVYNKLSPLLEQLNFVNYHILAQTTDYISEFKQQSRLVYASSQKAPEKECQL